MIVISEWLPNPLGSDAESEWVELWNAGEAAVDLSGWQLSATAGKPFVLQEAILRAGDYLLLPRSDTKLALRNVNGTLSLYDAGGVLADKAGFLGSAPEGKSANRAGDLFFFAAPTPAAPNATFLSAALIDNQYPLGQPLRGGPSLPAVLGLLVITSTFLAALLVYIARNNETLSKFFSKRDETIRG